MRAFVFPGQGSQYVGMSKELYDQFPWTRKLYDEASESIKMDLFKLCQDGPEDQLMLTQNGQPAILTTSYCWLKVIEKETDIRPKAGAGHSLGEYSALLAAGAMTLSEAAFLVRNRGRLMQEAVPVGKGKMAALIGLDDDKVIELCKRSSADGKIVVAVNFNSPGQVVIAGHTEAVDKAIENANGAIPELKARKAVPLNVSAPFHSPLMEPVRAKFKPFLDGVNWKAPAFPICFNVNAEVKNDPDIKHLLTEQINHPVLWTSCVLALKSYGVERFVEPGPGKVLTGLGKRITKEVETLNVESAADIKALQGVKS